MTPQEINIIMTAKFSGNLPKELEVKFWQALDSLDIRKVNKIKNEIFRHLYLSHESKIICKVCIREFWVPSLKRKDIENGEELPDICDECPEP